MNLCVIVLTSNVYDEDRPPRHMPKVCYHISGKSMLERCLENVLRLNPKRIILMVSKNHILYINKLLKHVSYSKKVSYCVYGKERKISSAQNCYSGMDLLVVPGNSPLLSIQTMIKLVFNKKSCKITDNIFYLNQDDLKEKSVDKIDDLPFYEGLETDIDEDELFQIETKGDLDRADKLFLKKQKIHDKILSRNRHSREH